MVQAQDYISVPPRQRPHWQKYEILESQIQVQTQIVPWPKGAGTILFPLLLSLVELLSFVLVALDLTVWHGWLIKQVVVVVIHLPLMHVV